MFEAIALDPELEPGARNAVEVCLALQPGERLTVITDHETAHIAASLVRVSERLGCSTRSFVLEDEAPRPHRRFPARILQDVMTSDATISCFQPQEGEIGSRRELIEVVEEIQIRYAHMVWISTAIMQQAMRADYRAVDDLSSRVLERARAAERVTVRTESGTDLEATFDPHMTWVKTSGLINRRYWSNLPGGEVFTTPKSVNGTFVVDGAVGDYLCPKYGDISRTPLRLEIADGILVDAQCDNADLLADFTTYCHLEENSDRVGEFAIGTNISVTQMIGNLLQDEKVPGVHIAFGNPYASQTGATWNCSTHIDAISRRCNIWVDSSQIMDDGHFLI